MIIKNDSKTRITKYDVENDSYEHFSDIDELIEEPVGYFLNEKWNKLYLINTDATSYNRDVLICDLDSGWWGILRNCLSVYQDFVAKRQHFHNIDDEIHILYQNKNKAYRHEILNSLNNNYHEFNEMKSKAYQIKGDKCYTAYFSDLKKFYALHQIVARYGH